MQQDYAKDAQRSYPTTNPSREPILESMVYLSPVSTLIFSWTDIIYQRSVNKDIYISGIINLLMQTRHVKDNRVYNLQDLRKYDCNLPRLVMLTGRQDSAVQKVIDDLKSRPIDPEELALLQNIHTAKISGHLGRGYVILGKYRAQVYKP